MDNESDSLDWRREQRLERHLEDAEKEARVAGEDAERLRKQVEELQAKLNEAGEMIERFAVIFYDKDGTGELHGERDARLFLLYTDAKPWLDDNHPGWRKNL